MNKTALLNKNGNYELSNLTVIDMVTLRLALKEYAIHAGDHNHIRVQARAEELYLFLGNVDHE